MRLGDIGFGAVGDGGIGDFPIGGTTIRETDDSGLLLQAGLTKEFAQADFSASYFQQVTPSSFGAQRTTEGVEVRTEYRFTRLFRIYGRLFWRNESSEAELRNTLNRDYLAFRIGLVYQLNEQWTLDARYRRRMQELNPDTSSPIEGESNFVGLQIGYRPGKFPLAQLF